jgi:hypothetical protein
MQLSALPGDPLNATAVPDRATGLSKLRDRTSYGLLEISLSGNTDRLTVASAASTSTANALTSVLQTTEARSGRRLTVVDIRPPAPGDHNGLSAFYLVVGWMVGGYLAASLLGLSSGARSANVHRITIRLIALALYATITALLGALIVGPGLNALPTDTLRRRSVHHRPHDDGGHHRHRHRHPAVRHRRQPERGRRLRVAAAAAVLVRDRAVAAAGSRDRRGPRRRLLRQRRDHQRPARPRRVRGGGSRAQLRHAHDARPRPPPSPWPRPRRRW